MLIYFGAVPAGQALKNNSQQKHAVRFMFYQSKFAHTREIFKEQKILNIYQSNILSSIIFMHCVKYKTAPSIFLTKFCRPSHTCPTNFLAHNFLTLSLKFKKK